MILSRIIKWRIECNHCQAAWIYPEGEDPVPWIVGRGWVVDDGRHTCPRCVRRAK